MKVYKVRNNRTNEVKLEHKTKSLSWYINNYFSLRDEADYAMECQWHLLSIEKRLGLFIYICNYLGFYYIAILKRVEDVFNEGDGFIHSDLKTVLEITGREFLESLVN